MDIKKIVPYVNNPRKNDRAVDVVASSLKEFGWKQPIVIDKENVIVVGHTRYMAAQKLGMTEVPTIVADELTDNQIKAYRIADNKTAQYSEWDDELLVLELRDLHDQNYDLLNTAFSDIEINSYLNDDDLVPDELPDLGIEGEDFTADRFVIVYETQEEKDILMERFGFKDKIIHTLADFEDDLS